MDVYKLKTRFSSIAISQWLDMAFGLFVAGITLYLFVAAPQLIDEVLLEPEEIPPIFFPRLILAFISGLSLLAVIRIFIGKTVIQVDLSWTGLRRMMFLLASMLLYILLFKRLGFILSSAVLLLFMSWYYGNRNWVTLAALVLAFPPLVYLLFNRVFHIFLPRGIL